MRERKSKQYATDLKEFKSDGKWAADQNQWRVTDARERLESFDADKEKEERLHKHFCRTCHYFELKSVCAFDAITYKQCAVCSKDMVFGSSLTDKICESCASEHAVCRHCLQPMD